MKAAPGFQRHSLHFSLPANPQSTSADRGVKPKLGIHGKKHEMHGGESQDAKGMRERHKVEEQKSQGNQEKKGGTSKGGK